MNDLEQMVQFIFDKLQPCRTTDKDGDSWFVAMDVCNILEIKSCRNAVRNFPPDEKDYVVIPGTSEKPRALKTQRVLIINESGVMRLILKSRKKNSWEFKERIIYEGISPISAVYV